MRERYWKLYISIKHESYYYKHFQLLLKRINWGITAVLTLTTLSSIAAWDIWDKYRIVWAIIICFSQVIQALFPKLPYNDLLISTRFMISSLDRLLIDIDYDWMNIDVHDLSEDEILVLITKHQRGYSSLVNQFFSGEYLPVIKYCEQKAERDCKNFFSVTYQA